MATDYKIFVHVFDPETRQPVAQDDARPHRGAFRTPLWAPGEVVGDRIPISLAGVPAGSHGLAIGIHAPETMKRLSITAEDGSYRGDWLQLSGESVIIEPDDLSGQRP
jgi:hypothetical protein